MSISRSQFRFHCFVQCSSLRLLVTTLSWLLSAVYVCPALHLVSLLFPISSILLYLLWNQLSQHFGMPQFSFDSSDLLVLVSTIGSKSAVLLGWVLTNLGLTYNIDMGKYSCLLWFQKNCRKHLILF